MSTATIDYADEFPVRHRFPRPIARAYESVCFATNPGDEDNRARWCASVAVRFCAAVRQACHCADDPRTPINIPSSNDYKLDPGPAPLPLEIADPLPVPLLQVAGVLQGAAALLAKPDIVAALSGLAFMARYRLAIHEPEGVRMLYGPHIEYLIWQDRAADVDPGTPLLVDPGTGDYVSLAPLFAWERPATEPFGRLFLLRGARGTEGHYIEDGVPGSPGAMRPITGRPRRGRLTLTEENRPLLAGPRVRFPDGSEPLGRFRVFGLIWRGGTSDIFAVRATGSGALRALKTFENERGGFDENYWRFMNEERFSSGIDHPAVVKPSLVRSEEAGAFSEQELVTRGSLGDLLDYNGVLTAGLALDITRQLLDALRAVHGRGIAHNDIKPDNILFDDAGRVRLIDFGIAVDAGDARNYLKPGVPAGSEGYCAPEVRRGAMPDAASDIYAAGMVCARMLAGTPAGAPAYLREFIGGCCAADPGERYATAESALSALARVRPAGVRAITLDIEGTLVTSYDEKLPRPMLHEFLSFLRDRFDIVFVYTTLDEARAREVFEQLESRGHIPPGFAASYRYVHWSCGRDGSLKDLRACRVPLEQNAIVDDNRDMIPEDQHHRWILVSDYNERRGHDRGLRIALERIMKKFGIS